MKALVSTLSLALITAFPLAGFADSSLEKDPAYLPIDKVLDLKTIRPEVNVNLPRFLLKDAVAGLKGAGGSLTNTGINFADLIKDVKLIRIVVIEANQTNRPALDKAVKTLREKLEAKWTPIVSVTDGNVGVYAMEDPSGDSMAGLAFLVYDGGDAVIGNVVGNVSIGKLLRIASQMNKFPKSLLRSLGSDTNRPPLPTAGAGTGTTAAVEAPTAPAKEPVQ